MKLAYKTWNKEHYVSDDIIIRDLEVFSGGELSVADETFIGQPHSSSSKKTSQFAKGQ